MTPESKKYTLWEAGASLVDIFSQFSPEDQLKLAKVAAIMANIEPAAYLRAEPIGKAPPPKRPRKAKVVSMEKARNRKLRLVDES